MREWLAVPPPISKGPAGASRRAVTGGERGRDERGEPSVAPAGKKYGTFDAAGQVHQRPGGRDRGEGAGQLTPRTRPPGWQGGQNEGTRWLAVISEIGVPQRGQGCPPRRWTTKKSRGLRWTSSPISRRTFSVESINV